MNTQPTRLSGPTRFSRAEFSPVLRKATRGLALRELKSPFRPDARRVTGWDPHLLDRLQSPLTRYRD